MKGQSKEAFKKLAKRWHPDKFLQNFGKRLVESQAERIMLLVKEVFQEVNDAKNTKPSFSYMHTG